MTRQILNPHAELKILRNARMLEIEAGILKRVRHRVGLAAPLPIG